MFEHPQLDRADADLTYPDYTGLPAKRIEDTRRITAVEGSQLELTLQLNKPVQSALLVDKKDEENVLQLSTDPGRAMAELTLLTARSMTR